MNLVQTLLFFNLFFLLSPHIKITFNLQSKKIVSLKPIFMKGKSKNGFMRAKSKNKTFDVLFLRQI